MNDQNEERVENSLELLMRGKEGVISTFKSMSHYESNIGGNHS